MSSQLTEDDVRQALGIDPKKTSPHYFMRQRSDVVKKLDARPLPKARITIDYRVRKKTGGPVSPYTYESDSISMLEAEIAGKKEIESKGLVIWMVMDKRFN